MDQRRLRALYLLAGLGLVISVFIPTGEIETPWPPYTLQAWAWMEPFTWPLLFLGFMLIAATWRMPMRPRIPVAAFLLGATSILLFLVTLAVGRRAVYDLWFPEKLGPAGLLDYHIELLAIHFSVMLAMAFGGLFAQARDWWKARAGTPPLVSPAPTGPK